MESPLINSQTMELLNWRKYIFENFLESSPLKQLSDCDLWEDEIEKGTQRSVTTSLRGSLTKKKEQN